MKTAEKLAAGWLLTLGFMFLTLSVSTVLEKMTVQKSVTIPVSWDGSVEFSAVKDTPIFDETAAGFLMFGVPSTILGGWLTLGLYRQSRQEKKLIQQQLSDRIQSTFYQMLLENDGRITVLNFAIQSQLPAATARQYLDDKAKEFHANFQVNEEGAVSYHFDI
ncbi:MAG: hypothetical protein KME21_13075 [Desmonostoc vinosum HA7617-LM4]|jgi:hypothetical protein|nr:hypothetical protein [Desmonostoc vinosum HA7617-LM4]